MANLAVPKAVLLLCLGTVIPALDLTAAAEPNIKQQSFQSAFYPRDDVQYFPAGPVFKLAKQVDAIEEYVLGQQDRSDGDSDSPIADASP